MCFTIHHGEHLCETLKLPRLLKVSGALRSRPPSWELQRLVSNVKRLILDKILNISVSSRESSQSRLRKSHAHPWSLLLFFTLS